MFIRGALTLMVGFGTIAFSVGLPASAAPVAGCATGPGTAEFGYTGAAQTFTVPACVHSLVATVNGAAGGGYFSPNNAKLGGRSSATLPVTPGSRLTLVVGERGTPAPSGTVPIFGGGGAGGAGGQGEGAPGGSGGGGTFLFGPAATTWLVAGGAGGFGNSFGGGEGGGAGSPAVGGGPGLPDDVRIGGGPGTDTAGGAGGQGESTGAAGTGAATNPTAAEHGLGGAGAAGDSGGGGGGGGYYGGGGGGYSPPTFEATSGGGGGGSGYAYSGAKHVTGETGVNTGDGSIALSWTAYPELRITTTSLPDGTVGAAYSVALRATGGLAPYSWKVTAGTLPGGLVLNPDTGVVRGRPTRAGTASLTVRVTDSEDPQTATHAFTVAVAGAASSSASSPASSAPTSPTPRPSSPPAPIASTGADVSGPIQLGLLLLACGAGLLAAARHRRPAPQHQRGSGRRHR